MCVGNITLQQFIIPILLTTLVARSAGGQQGSAALKVAEPDAARGATPTNPKPAQEVLPLTAPSASGPKNPAARHVFIYHQPRRFAGFPANHGIWCWGNEILVGFSAGDYKDLGPDRHAIDREKPEEHLLARSLDGGETWTIENPAAQGVLVGTAGGRHGTVPPGASEPEPTD